MSERPQSGFRSPIPALTGRLKQEDQESKAKPNLYSQLGVSLGYRLSPESERALITLVCNSPCVSSMTHTPSWSFIVCPAQLYPWPAPHSNSKHFSQDHGHPCCIHLLAPGCGPHGLLLPGSCQGMVLITSCPLWFLSLATPLHLTSNSAETQSHAHVQERCVKEPISQREKEAQPEEGLYPCQLLLWSRSAEQNS